MYKFLEIIFNFLISDLRQSLLQITNNITALFERLNQLERKIIDMSQEKFEEQMQALLEVKEAIDSNAKQESAQLSALEEVFKTEIADLKKQLEDCKGEAVDTSKLDDAIAQLRQSAVNVSNIVPSPQTDITDELPQPAEVVTDEPTEETTENPEQ